MGSMAAGAAAMRPSGLASASDTVRVACVGVRGQGRAHIKHYAQMPNVEIAAICEAFNCHVGELVQDGQLASAYVHAAKAILGEAAP